MFSRVRCVSQREDHTFHVNGYKAFYELLSNWSKTHSLLEYFTNKKSIN